MNSYLAFLRTGLLVRPGSLSAAINGHPVQLKDRNDFGLDNSRSDLPAVRVGLAHVTVTEATRERRSWRAKPPVWPPPIRTEERANDASDCRGPIETADIKVGARLVL